MARNAHRVVAAAAAAMLVVSCAVLVARAGDDGSATTVLGRQIVRRTTTTAVEATTTSLPELDLPLAVPIDVATTTTLVGATTTTTAHTTTTAAGEPVGRKVERADTTSAFDYRADGGGTMSTEDTGPPRDPFRFKALGSDVDHNGVAELRSEMTNQTNRDIAFPDGGLVLRFVITRDGQQWRNVELRFPDTQSLPPGGSLEIESATPLDQQYGHYQVTGEVTVEYK